MKLEQEILLNQYGQRVANIDQLISLFESFNDKNKRLFLKDLLYLIMQSKPNNDDIETSIKESRLKPSYTPCVLLKKGIEFYNLERLVGLPDNELKKVFVLLLTLFKIAYNRRFEAEKDHPSKWWYWNLSDSKKMEMILSMLEN